MLVAVKLHIVCMVEHPTGTLLVIFSIVKNDIPLHLIIINMLELVSQIETTYIMCATL